MRCHLPPDLSADASPLANQGIPLRALPAATGCVFPGAAGCRPDACGAGHPDPRVSRRVPVSIPAPGHRAADGNALLAAPVRRH